MEALQLSYSRYNKEYLIPINQIDILINVYLSQVWNQLRTKEGKYNGQKEIKKSV
jgi:hypothetical protein